MKPHYPTSQLLLVVLFAAFLTPAVAQRRPPLTADSVALYQHHIGQTPGVYRYERHFAGDVNNDKRPDVVIIAQRTQHQYGDAPGGYSRRVILLLNQPNGQLRNAAYNDQLLRCTTCGGGSMVDPFQRVTFNGRFLSFVSMYGLGVKTTQIITFQFDPKRPDWWLYEIALQKYEYDATGKIDKTVSVDKLDVRKFGDLRFQDFTSKLIPKK